MKLDTNRSEIEVCMYVNEELYVVGKEQRVIYHGTAGPYIRAMGEKIAVQKSSDGSPFYVRRSRTSGGSGELKL